MTRYVALVRGINVGGKKMVAMADLRRLFADLGHEDVSTYIQSGNVVFTPAGGKAAKPAKLAKEIEDAIARDLTQALTVVVRTGDELAKLVAANPFLGSEPDPAKLFVAFLAEAPAKKQAAALAVPAGGPERLSLVGQDIYLHYPNGYGRSKLSNAVLEKQLGVRSTTRNWKTVTKLRELAGG